MLAAINILMTKIPGLVLPQGIDSRATNGTVTKSVASTVPGAAKMICTLCATSHWPNKPWAPKSKPKTRHNRRDGEGEIDQG